MNLLDRHRARLRALTRSFLRPLFRHIPVGLVVDIHVKPGHFYSPIPDRSEVMERAEWIFNREAFPRGVDLNEGVQLETLDKIERVYPEQPFREEPTSDRRFHLDNGWFLHSDALTYFGILRCFPVHHVVEIGSGYSSALVLDVNSLFFGGDLRCTFIDPYPERLEQLLLPEDRTARVMANPVQDIDLELFEGLDDGDILFIDCSHVSKIGSDVNFLFFEVLPRLKHGVLIHIHDIFWPFEYPEEWVLGPEHRAWNEIYLTHAFLQYNSSFRILFWGSYVERSYRDRIARSMPAFLKSPASSLWLQKT